MNQTNQPPAQTLPPSQMVAFEFDFVQALANYLGTRPYKEVFGFITKIQQTVQAAQGEVPPVPPDKVPPDKESPE